MSQRHILKQVNKPHPSASSLITSTAGTRVGFIVLLFVTVFINDSLFFNSSVSATSSSLSLSIDSSTISLDIASSSINGTFAKSSNSTIAVSTNNATGYTLSIKASNNYNNNTALIGDNGIISSIDSIISEKDFNTNTSYNNKWGYQPSKLNSLDNDNFLPSPSITGDILNITNCANDTTNCPEDKDEYSIIIGTRINSATIPGSYTNNFTITAIANAIPYTITYDANAGTDIVDNMPNNVDAATYDESVILSNNKPTRNGYLFYGWCTAVMGSGKLCTSTSYNPEGIYTLNQTANDNSLSLHAVWIPAMQSYTLSNCRTDASANDSYVYDVRDNNLYTVRILDGLCVMTQNLRYIGGNNGTVSAGKAVNSAGTSFTMTSSTAQTYTSPQYYESNNYDYGVYYNYCATSGGTVCADKTYQYFTTTTICPSGWTLPSQTVTHLWGGISTETLASIGNFNVFPGYYSDGGTLLNYGKTGYYWAGKVHDDYQYTTNYANLNLNYADGGTPRHDATMRLRLQSIRCMLDTSMQNITSADLSAMMPSNNDTVNLTDRRDGKIYVIVKLDGRYIMAEDLNFYGGDNTGLSSASWRSTNSAGTVFSLNQGVTETYTSPYAQYLSDSGANYRTYYNYCAASGNTICNNPNNTSATVSICPTGWSLPTTSGTTSWGNISTTSLISSGYFQVLNGYYTGGTLNGKDQKGLWWSANGNAEWRYDLWFSGSTINASDTTARTRLLTIRCIKT